MEHLRMTSRDLVQDNVEAIGKLFPNCIKEVRDSLVGALSIDFDALKQELSHSLIEGRTERYEFNWPGKRAAALLANTPIEATLRPCREESVNFDTTENLYIEGDNLDVLKLLCDNYRGKIKMIYIDPPYNTGNDFIYEDDFAQAGEDYNDVSGDYDNQGNRLRKNTDTSGRYHTDWLNMIYPRLKVAYKLLRDDGVVFISIDDNEVANLRKICDDVFGEYNFVAQFVWKSKLGKVGTASTVSSVHEYILCFSKNINYVQFKMIETQNEGRKENLRQWGQADRREDRPSMFYPITLNGKTVYPIKDDGTEGRWRVSVETAKELLRKGELVLGEKDGKDNIYRIFPAGITRTSYSSLLLDDIGTTAKGTITLQSLSLGKYFDYPKPVELLNRFLILITKEDDIILDFFSGSATTAHAVMQLNADDGDNGHRKFIMVQLPEECAPDSEAAKAGYKNICEIGKERIRRAGKKIAEENATNAPNLDIGFRVLKLDSSNMADVYYRPSELKQGMLNLQEDNVKPGRTAEDLLFQVMLEKDIPLSSKIETEKVAGKTIFNVADGYLLACFDKGVTDDVVTAIAKKQPVHAVFRDAGMATDSTAINFDQIFENYSPDTKRSIL